MAYRGMGPPAPGDPDAVTVVMPAMCRGASWVAQGQDNTSSYGRKRRQAPKVASNSSDAESEAAGSPCPTFAFELPSDACARL